jgi:uncharacterized protein DUF3179
MKRVCALILGLVLLVGLAWVATPMVLIQPFAPQTRRGLAVAYSMRGLGPSLTLGLLILGLAAASVLWPRLVSWKGRVLAGSAVALLAGCAFLSRQNHFEWMFRPLPRPGFVDAAQAKDVADDDLVLGVEVGPESHAYPVRAMAYHHVVNDVIAGEPIVATY